MKYFNIIIGVVFFVLVVATILCLAIGLSSCNSVDTHTISNLTFSFNDHHHRYITYIDFDIEPGVENAEISITSDGRLINCALTAGGTHAHCEINKYADELVKPRFFVR